MWYLSRHWKGSQDWLVRGGGVERLVKTKTNTSQLGKAGLGGEQMQGDLRQVASSSCHHNGSDVMPQSRSENTIMHIRFAWGVKNSHHLHQFYQSLHLLTSLFSSQYWFCIFQSHKDTSLAAFICQFEALSKVGREALTLCHILNMAFVADVVIVTKNRLT